MVALKWLLISALTTVSVLAQDPTGDDAEAAAYWGADIADAVDGTPDEKRDVTIVKVPRTNPPVVLKDPYKGSYCRAPYTKPPCETTCNRNNCFRGLLNARDGSDGKHCPKEAFGFCCLYNFASDWQKFWAIKYGIIEHIAPYTANCKGSGDSTLDVLKKLNDACGCTLNHEVKVDTTSDYYKLRYFSPHSPQCH
ncbi:hypothetical protein BR93DRAFT_955518 [Coniochaeta sp. PMI_546]|nr:hypothetical protein BR93DRAFT_955518 [Coniochaeta sp. PMI_546]